MCTFQLHRARKDGSSYVQAGMPTSVDEIPTWTAQLLQIPFPDLFRFVSQLSGHNVQHSSRLAITAALLARSKALGLYVGLGLGIKHLGFNQQ